MKKLIFILFFIILHLSFVIQNCYTQWEQVSSGMGNEKYVYSLAVNGNNIIAGLYNLGVWISTDNGNNWIQTALNDQLIFSLAASGNKIFAGTAYNGIWVSSNNGNNWTQTGLNSETIYSITIDGTIIYAGTYLDGLYSSTNDGNSWSLIGLNNKAIISLAKSGNNIFASTFSQNPYFHCVYLSTDNGSNWAQTSLYGIEVNCLLIKNNYIFAGATSNGIWSSTNNGSNWLQTSLNDKHVYSITMYNDYLFAGCFHFDYYEKRGVWLSTNYGINWISKNQGFNINIPAIRILQIVNNYIFAGTHGQSIWRCELSYITGIQNISTEIPSAFSLEQNYPNPFNSMTKINFSIPSKDSRFRGNDKVVLKVFDILGKEVATLVNEYLQPGTYETTFDASTLSGGIYFYRLQTENYTATKKLILLK